MASVHVRRGDERSVRDEIGRQQDDAARFRKVNKRRVNVLVREPLHRFVVPQRMRGDVNRLRDAWRGHAGCFDSLDCEHGQYRNTTSRLAQRVVTHGHATVRYAQRRKF